MLLAFASGLMISALSFDLFQEAYDLGGVTRAGIGLMIGAVTFVVVNALLDHHVADSRADQREKLAEGARGGGVGFALLAAVVLDGAPENLALGGVADETLAFVLAFAGGAVLAALADTLMPEAFEHGAPWNALATAVGFFLAFVLAGA